MNPIAGWLHRRGAGLGLLLLAAVLLLPGLDRQAMTREQELRVACTAQDMAKGGAWLLPRYMEELRLKKPPLMYWLVAAGMQLSGATHSVWAARLPTALFGIALVGLIYAGGARLIGRRRAMAGALAAACSFLFVRFGRIGETDIPLAFFATATMFFLWRAMNGPRRGGAWIGAGVCAGLGFMIKGPAAIVLPVLTALAYAVAVRPARRHLRSAGPALSLAVFALLAAPWYLYLFHAPAAKAAAEAAVGSELSALVVKTGHAASWAFYLYTLPYALLPTGPLLLPALYLAFRRFRHHARIRFLLVWLTVPLLAMSLIKSKQIHYVTLLMPQACLLIGLLLGHGTPARLTPGRWTEHYFNVFYLACLLLGLALALLPLWQPAAPRALLVGGGLALAALAFLAFRLRILRGGLVPRLAALAGLLAILVPVYVFGLEDLTQGDEAIPHFTSQIGERVRQVPHAFFVGGHRSAFTFYLDRDLIDCADFASAWSQAHPGDAILVRRDRRQGDHDWPENLPPVLEAVSRNIRLALFIRPGLAAGAVPEGPNPNAGTDATGCDVCGISRHRETCPATQALRPAVQ